MHGTHYSFPSLARMRAVGAVGGGRSRAAKREEMSRDRKDTGAIELHYGLQE